MASKGARGMWDTRVNSTTAQKATGAVGCRMRRLPVLAYMDLPALAKLWARTWTAAAAVLARVCAVQAEDHVVIAAAHLRTQEKGFCH